jgi:hypothetical protein
MVDYRSPDEARPSATLILSRYQSRTAADNEPGDLVLLGKKRKKMSP